MYTVLARPAHRWGVGVQLLFVAYTQAASLLAIGAIPIGLLGAWLCCLAAGGSHTAAPHLFYLPIILAAVRFSWPAGALTALVAGLLAGPALPANVATGTEQSLHDWLLRLGAFLVISMFIATLMRGRGEPLRAGVQDSLSSTRLVRAVHTGEIDVHYQPICRLDDLTIKGFEALARWSDPRRGPVPPGEFIPAAERTGAISVLDEHVLARAVAQTQHWSEEYGPLTISVNVSATRFGRPGLATDVQQVLDSQPKHSRWRSPSPP